MKPKSYSKRRSENEWQLLVNECIKSGKKVSIFCQEKNLCVVSFYKWKKQFYPLKKGAIQKTETENLFVPVQIKSQSKVQSEFVLHYPNGCYLSISSDCHLKILSAIHAAMGVS